ncbi:hypothetical protein EFS21_02550 [Levilactobacillus brevis]|jgi:hypothetical protein|uniref:Uncharacterized protein n=2 Tax=Levilactobacillus brevis TaxID=1580 RepID=Q03TQ6_LEVBA|nr:hypothetical protein [Levilactobacillus brevis]MBL3536023.1 hypothetical protein [Lactobacillus sp. GPR40-2]MBL3629189.1 hypothetical protein [Lactobacillus sp. GPB7-4]ABJ63416.1 hypothetical protein LVIS_0250 [Levilactobacillus brevis ATCC 367]ARQ93162.1 hypothetical protein A6F60_05375 [Levilactobacillus brevis]ARW21166.1 hypothetical protein S101174_00284 [Levilactobacillus brevis]
MSRPGNYGKSSRLKQLRQLKRKKSQQASRTIAWDQVEDFLLGRYHLVQGNRLPATVDATVQRFFSEWLQTALAQGEPQLQWDIAAITATTFKRIGNQVPWQFYAVLLEQVMAWQKFLLREGPVVPLVIPRQIIKPLTATAWAALVADQLAVNLLTIMATPITAEQREQLTKSFLADGHVQWSAVAALFAPLGFTIQASADESAHQWLTELLALTVSDFHH